MDPFSTLLTLLRPQAVDSKLIEGSVAYPRVENLGFGLVLQGQSRLQIEEGPTFQLYPGDFVLLPPNDGFVMTGDADFRMLGGYVQVEPGQSELWRGLFPGPLLLQEADRLGEWIQMVRQEALDRRPGRELILQKLVEILLVEALRSCPTHSGLLRGLADPALAVALECIHQQPRHGWTLRELAGRANLSRSAFCQSFSRCLGVAPKEYLIQWRLSLAKDLLARGTSLKEVAQRVGYQSASAFSTAFRRHFGQSPGHWVHQTIAAC